MTNSQNIRLTGVFVLTLSVLFSSLFLEVPPTQSAEPEISAVVQPTVFQYPALRSGEQQVLALLRYGKTDQALQVLESLLSRFPVFSDLHYFHAVLLAKAGKDKEALAGLESAVSTGFADVERLVAEPTFQAMRGSEQFEKTLDLAKRNPKPALVNHIAEATLVRDGVALVSSGNTKFEVQTNLLQSSFKFRSRLFSDPKVMTGKSSLADRLNDLYRSGKASGNVGDLYDNRDRKHSRLSAKKFSQIGFIEYSENAVSQDIDFSFNDKIFFDAPTIGNASLGINGMWSVAKVALTNPRMSAMAYLQYRTNHIYVYPSVRDYAWPEYGTDNFVANTPYLIISKGKSGSDRPFLEAAAIALAALPPAVKKHAQEKGLISPTVQMLIRRGQTHVKSIDDYLSPKAHPVVFNAEMLNLNKIVDIAQTLTVENIPPRVEFVVLEESAADSANGQGKTEHVFTTPSAVARIITEPGGTKSFTISMASTIIQAGKKPKYHWRVLEGNPDLISIKKRNEIGSVAELVFQWHPRQPSLANPAVQTDRADVGVFVEIDGMISAPAIVSVSFPKK